MKPDLYTGAAACCVLLLMVSVSGAEQHPRVGGYFSSIHYASGDALGTAVWIVYSEGDFWAIVQTAEGHLTVPVVAPVSVSGQKVSFTVKYASTGKAVPDEAIKFSGIVTRSELRLDSGEVLKRRDSW